MQNPQPNPAPLPNASMVWLIWLSLIGSILIYGLVGIMVRSSSGPLDPDANLNMILGIFAMVGLATSVVTLLSGRFLARSGQYFTYCIVRWAMAESIAIFGLALYMIGADAPFFFIFLVWSLALMLLLMPNHASRDRFAEHARRTVG
ncbi:MAG: hypothetical protein P9M14_18210 [Candidatus Alcyoniella australis]|nr:hypothetical protein [Candidatus Alcyoniella australis]